MIFAVALGVNSSLLLNACEIVLPFKIGKFGNCSTSQGLSEQTELEKKRQELEGLINGLEIDLAGQICPKSPRPSTADITVQKPDLPKTQKIDEHLWRKGDLAAIEGCWGLNSSYVIIDQQTGKPSPQQTWNICFDGSGNGQQTMRSEDGVACESEVTGRFGAGGKLVIKEDKDLFCSGGVVVFKRTTTCVLDGTGGAACQSFQPRTGGRGSVRLQRKE